MVSRILSCGRFLEQLVEVKLCELPGELAVEVSDNGCGIADVSQARQPLFTTSTDRMGLGFVLMESFMDQVDVASAPGRGTRVKMCKASSEHRAQGGGRETNGGGPPHPAL